jgi:hypothetical protein
MAAPTEADLGNLLNQELAVRLVREVVAVLGPDVHVMPMKGTLVARIYYPVPWQRPMSDCDVLILGTSFSNVLTRLTRAGYRITDWARMIGGATVRSPTIKGLSLDLHARPLPIGLGTVSATWLATDAQMDTQLFGAPVLVPDPRRLLVHLLGNIAKDHVYRAFPHAVTDVAQVFKAREFSPHAFASMIRTARLQRGAWMALARVVELTGCPEASDLQTALGLSRTEVRMASSQLATLRSWASVDPIPWRARMLARAVGDNLLDITYGFGAAASGAMLAYARNRMRRR